MFSCDIHLTRITEKVEPEPEAIEKLAHDAVFSVAVVSVTITLTPWLLFLFSVFFKNMLQTFGRFYLYQYMILSFFRTCFRLW